MVLRRFWSFARNLTRKAAVERELDDEVRTYLQMLADDKVKTGMCPEDALREARKELGGLESVKEKVREVRMGNLAENFMSDMRYGLRMLAKKPGFTAVAVISLALGIGGNAAMSSIVDNVLIRSLPFSQPERLVRVIDYYPKAAVVDFQQQSQTMDLAAYSTDSEFNLSGQGEPEHLVGSSTSANFFSLLGARAEVGRTFQAAEDQPGRDRIVVLSHLLWQNKFGGDPNIIGRPVNLDGITREVVGVMPADFGFPSPSVRLWIPLHLDPSNIVDFWAAGWMPLIARLRPGATIQQARNEIGPLSLQLTPKFPFAMPPNWNAGAAVIPLQQDMVGSIRGKLLVLLCAVGCVLLIACANVASLLLARTTTRQKEIAIRAALGAGRGRIVRQLLTESVALALAGATVGFILAVWALSFLKSFLALNNARLAEASIDWRVLTFTAAVAIVTGLAFGLAPALSAAKLNLAESFKTRGQQSIGVGGMRLRSSLIAGELALAVVLTVGAGLLIKSLWLLAQVNPGFRQDQLLAIEVFPNQSLCQDRQACIALYNELVLRARGIDGVSDVAAANALPFSSKIPFLPVELEGHKVSPTEAVGPMLWAGAVTPGYFQVLGIPLLAGRTLTDGDGEKSAPVVLVSAATARHYWPGEDPVGKHIRAVWEDQWRTVVGVVGDVRQYDLAGNAPNWLQQGALYLPYPQSVGLDRRLPSTMNLILRTTGNSQQVANVVRQLVTNVNPNLPISEVRTMEAIASASADQSRSMMWLFAGFAASALILAAIGTYGVISYSTSQRTNELGIRVALGATRAGLFGLVLKQSLRLVLAGLALGVAASLALTRMLSAFLYGVTATDPITLAAVGAVLIATALMAGYFPARKAASVDPLTALRAD